MNENFKRGYKLISSLIMCVISLFSCVTLTFSWFSFNGETSGGGADVDVVSSDDFLGCEYYYADPDEKNGYVFKKAETAEQKSLGEFDILNDKHQLVLKLCFKQNIKSVCITAGTSTDYFLGNPDFPLSGALADNKRLPQTAINADGKEYTNALSSVVCFNVLTSGANGLVAQTDASGAQTGNYYLENLPENGYVKFMQSNAETALPAKKITVNAAADTVEGTYNGQACKVIYLMLGYDKTLMTTIFSVNIGNEVLNFGDDEQKSIPFFRDFYIGLESNE